MQLNVQKPLLNINKNNTKTFSNKNHTHKHSNKTRTVPSQTENNAESKTKHSHTKHLHQHIQTSPKQHSINTRSEKTQRRKDTSNPPEKKSRHPDWKGPSFQPITTYIRHVECDKYVRESSGALCNSTCDCTIMAGPGALRRLD